MKKILAFLTAIAMLGLVSCESDKPEKPHDTAISEPVEEIPAEPEFREYNKSDFKEINVALNKINGDPPMKITEIDLSGVLDEKIISPCKLPENRESLKESISYLGDVENFDEFCDTEIKGTVENFALDGDIIYMLVNYDLLCTHSHCFKIVAYNTKTEVLDELYSVSSLEVNESLRDIFAFGGELYVLRVTYDDENESVSTLSRLENGSFEAVLTADEFPRNLENFGFFNKSPDRFILQNYGFIDNDYELSLCEYDPESNSLTEVFYGKEYYGDVDLKLPKFFDNEIITAELDENKKTCIVGESFRLNTGVRGGIPMAAGGDRIAILVEDSIQSLLYTYDLDKMECYISDVSDKMNGNLIHSVGKNIVLGHYTLNISGTRGIDLSCYLLMPELGAFFNIATDMRANSYYPDYFLGGIQALHLGYNNGRFWAAEAVDANATQFVREDEFGLEYNEAILGKFIIVEVG